jgi:hypothetical protein
LQLFETTPRDEHPEDLLVQIPPARFQQESMLSKMGLHNEQEVKDWEWGDKFLKG